MRKPIIVTMLSATLVGSLFVQRSVAKSDIPELSILHTQRLGPPVKLTASDGTGLELSKYEAKVVVQGPLAFTELHLIFKNPQARIIEGHFEITLPEQAALSRLAMKTDKGWQEAEVVELQKARQAYEDFLHRRQDPALLEKQAGNQFQCRVFPIPASGQKELVISYSQELSGESRQYRLATAGLSKVDDLSVEASVWTGPSTPPTKLHYSLHSESPHGDFVVHNSPPVSGLINGDEVLIKVQAQGSAQADPSQSLLVMVDTSASRTAGYKAQTAALKALLEDWTRTHPQGKLKVACFDQEVVPLSDRSDEALKMLGQRKPLGATDLAKALRWASQQKGYQRLLIVTDGVSTAGSDSLAGSLKSSSFRRFDAVLMGGIRDSQSLQTLVYHTLPQSGFVLDGDLPSSELCHRLAQQPLSGVKVNLPGADWVWPEVLDGVAPGEDRLVYARMRTPQDHVDVSLISSCKSGPVRVALSPVTGPLLHKASVAANLARLERQYHDAHGMRKDEIGRHMIEISTGNRVVCDLTGLLILETDADYARFDIERKALKDIMVVTPDGVGLEHRDQAVVFEQPPAPQQQLRKHKTGAATPQPSDRSGPPQEMAKMVPGLEADNQVGASLSTPSSSRAAGLPAQQRDEPSPVQPPVAERPAVPPPSSPMMQSNRRRPPVVTPPSEDAKTDSGPALTGEFARIDALLKAGDSAVALQAAQRWQSKEPGDVLALVALGKSLQARGQSHEAARAYGSIIDLYPGRADLRRYAACMLETLSKEGQALSQDSFAKALAQRPDHPSGYRMKAYSLVRMGREWEAFQVLEEAFKRDFPEGRFAGIKEILSDDLGLVGATIIARHPEMRKQVLARLDALTVPLQDKPSMRFILTWETDANDVDFHIKDNKGGHAYYSVPALASGGRLYADVTTGYGPECFNIPGRPQAFPYNISIHYYSRGPMGYGMGKVEIVRHDGKGGLRFEERPFVVMNDHAFVNLGEVKPD